MIILIPKIDPGCDRDDIFPTIVSGFQLFYLSWNGNPWGMKPTKGATGYFIGHSLGNTAYLRHRVRWRYCGNLRGYNLGHERIIGD